MHIGKLAVSMATNLQDARIPLAQYHSTEL